MISQRQKHILYNLINQSQIGPHDWLTGKWGMMDAKILGSINICQLLLVRKALIFIEIPFQIHENDFT